MALRISALPYALRCEAQNGFIDALRISARRLLTADWRLGSTDTPADLLDRARLCRADIDHIPYSRGYAEGQLERAAYSLGRDLGLAWVRRHTHR